ncbi:class I adenylate-forming enzyme family protein [Shimazuella alba]|uniref:AMP-binding protein n=1 Tax=Shimazuella alba TaxID=2690964 RepID=A0A6I4VWM8_9BACL|nr:AMP-binding protein [Shimazuella alba]MXQ54290.1 AMP-binding protein [Shimazuella alba]
MNINLGSLLQYRASTYPHEEVAVDDKYRFTQSQLNQYVNQITHWLQKKNIRSGDRIAVLSQNSVPAFAIYIAAAKIGAIVLPLNCGLAVEELRYRLNDGTAKILFYAEAFTEVTNYLQDIETLEHFVSIPQTDFFSIFSEESVEDPAMAEGGDNPFLIIYTSGTTGKSKGVVITHHNLYTAIVSDSHHLDWRTGDRTLIVTPMFHISGTLISFVNLLKGGTNIFLPVFHPRYTWQLIQDERITQFMAIPSILRLIVQDPSWMQMNIDSLRYIICGADAVPRQLIEQYTSYGIEICQVYGCTETTGALSFWTPRMGIEKSHTVGKPVLHMEWKVVDIETGEELPVGQVGEVVIRGPLVFKEYWNQPEATQKTLRDGWLHTEDLGKMDQDGYLLIVDRYKDLIISDGEHIYPTELESIFYQMEGVKEVAVIGVPDDVYGQVPAVFIAKYPQSVINKADIMQKYKEELVSYKCEKHLYMVDQLPRNSLGKIVKDELRKQFANMQHADSGSME